MKQKTWRMDVLCKVIDNFGDAGLAYRLCKSFLNGPYRVERLRLFIDKASVFMALQPAIEAWSGRFEILPWDAGQTWTDLGPEAPDLVLEAFGCGLPTAYLDYLAGFKKNIVIHNLEYLSAESWVGEFHKVPGLSPSPWLRRYFFMPGFNTGTGGLFHDPGFMGRRLFWESLGRGSEFIAQRRNLLNKLIPDSAQDCPINELARRPWFTVFSYEHPYAGMIQALKQMEEPPLVLLAHGRGVDSFLDPWKHAGSPFPLLPLPFLDQETWDDVLLASDFSVIRGEESLARASLLGKPFVWHAYLQDDKDHGLKVDAFVETVLSGLADLPRNPGIQAWAGLMADFNDRKKDQSQVDTLDMAGRESWTPLLRDLQDLSPYFTALSQKIESLGDLAHNLLTFSLEVLYDADSKIQSVGEST